MAYNNKIRSMSNQNGKIFIEIVDGVAYGVSIYDIQTVLGRSTGDLGLLCSDQEWYDNNGTPTLRPMNVIKMWAKYKPVVNTIFDTYSQLEEDAVNHRMVWKASSDWWRGLQGNCGIDIPTYSLGTIVGTDDIWEYTKPQGGIHPFRILDFNQYNHNAQKPIILTIDDSAVLGRLAAYRASLYIWPAGSLPDYNLLLSDIGNFKNYYFGIVVSNGVQAYIKTNAVNINTTGGGDIISLDGCPLIQSVGDYDVYAVLASVVQTSWTNIYNGNIWSLNCEDGYGHKVVTVVAPAENVYKIVVIGLTIEDKRGCWLKRGNITASLVSGDLVGTDTQFMNMSKSYTLQSVTWQVMRYSDSEIVRTGTGAVAQTSPSTLPATKPSDSTTFRTPFNVGTLPELSASDYYVITYTFNYS